MWKQFLSHAAQEGEPTRYKIQVKRHLIVNVFATFTRVLIAARLCI